MKLIKILVATCILAFSLPSFASPRTDVLSTCLADNTNGKDRKELVRWLFASMASHPEMKELLNGSTINIDRVSKPVAVIFTRLLSESCVTEVKAVVKNEGSQALGTAFEALGRVAVQELLTNRDVQTAVGSFEKYVDRKKVAEALEK